MKNLVDLKFALEKEINILSENFENSKTRQLKSVNDDIDIYAALCLYQNNIYMHGTIYLKKQQESLKQINDILLQKCEHNWIYDVVDGIFNSRDICYCSNCFIRK